MGNGLLFDFAKQLDPVFPMQFFLFLLCINTMECLMVRGGEVKMAPAAGTTEDFFAPQIVSDQEDLSSKVANLATFTQDKKAGSNGNFWCLHL